MLALLIAAVAAFPLGIGSWVYEDADGARTTITVSADEDPACLQASWSSAEVGDGYQWERWCEREGGSFVVAKAIRGRDLGTSPVMLLPSPFRRGASWTGELTMNGRSQGEATLAVGAVETVATKAGTFEAQRVEVGVPGARVVRWYAAGVGMVREATYLGDGDAATLLEDKRLVGRLARR